MELLYIYIHKPYGALREQGFNISSKYTIDYNPKQLTLTIKKNTNVIPHFFGENIQDVTCVIGENGVGKTTFIRYVKELFFERRNQIGDRIGDIVVYKKEDKAFIYMNKVDYHFDIDKVTDEMRTRVVIYQRHPKLFDRLNETLTIYYSNNYDLFDDFIESEILYNTSTPFLSRTYNSRINKEFRTKNVNAEQRFLLNEFQRNRKFLQSEKSQSIKRLLKPVDYIEIIPVSKKSNDYKSLAKTIHKLYPVWNDNEKRIFIDIIDQVATTFYLTKKETQTDYKRQLFDIELCEIIIFELLVKLIKSKIDSLDIYHFKQVFINTIDNNNIKGYINTVLRKGRELFLEFSFKWKEREKELYDYFYKLEELVDLLIYQDELWEMFADRAAIKTNSELLDAIIKCYFELPFSTKTIKLEWPRLSAGEESMITFFSRIDAALRLKSKKRNTILILIDEGDLYFHPEWQRQYLNAIFEFLKQYKDFTFQILLTSHSPFVLSDLPRDNVITFQKNEKGNGINISKNTLNKTFGGNIHELLIDKFFLSNGIIGAFADNKIIELIDRVNNNKITKQDEILINEIGDKFLAATIRTNLEERNDKN